MHALTRLGFGLKQRLIRTNIHFIHDSDNVLFVDDTLWTDLPYAHQIQLARKEYGWTRRLTEEVDYNYTVDWTNSTGTQEGNYMNSGQVQCCEV